MVTVTSADRMWFITATDVPAEKTLSPTASQWHDEQRLSDPYTEHWLGRIREQAYKSPKVKAVYVSIANDPSVDYWIVIEHRDLSVVRSLIEDQQKSIVDLFARTENPPFRVDFHICYREGRDERDLVPSDAIRVPRS